jgi:hypothetical protein
MRAPRPSAPIDWPLLASFSSSALKLEVIVRSDL